MKPVHGSSPFWCARVDELIYRLCRYYTVQISKDSDDATGTLLGPVQEGTSDLNRERLPWGPGIMCRIQGAVKQAFGEVCTPQYWKCRVPGYDETRRRRFLALLQNGVTRKDTWNKNSHRLRATTATGRHYEGNQNAHPLQLLSYTRSRRPGGWSGISLIDWHSDRQQL